MKRVPGIEIRLVGGRNGVFDVFADERLVFSKDKEYRFPTVDEVVAALQD
ncbi:MAG: Rdx family protein [Candidatus Eisenbacteria bacterium]|nr:Rdx family protein [Candidatus Eisenbacteria bacterium]